MRALVLLVALSGCSDYAVNGIRQPVDLGPGDTGAPNPTNPGVVDPVPGFEVGGVRGRVCAPDGQSWISGATVTVAHEEGVTTGETNGDGWFLLEGIPAGTYDLLVQKGSFSAVYEVVIQASQVAELPVETCAIQQGQTRIAVLTGDYDHIQTILGDLGLQYDLVNGVGPVVSTNFLRDPAAMAAYDVIFFNCGISDAWLDHEAEIGNNLREFVTAGGSIYASDWAYYIVESSFRDQNTFHGNDLQPGSAKVGEAGAVTANVLSPSMQQLLGSSTASLNYDLGMWAAMVEAPLAETLIEGQYSYRAGPFAGIQTRYAPLASRFDYGNGTVIYTSFHNEQQTTVDMHLLLQDIVLSL